jgi:hypothetical protein
MGYDLPDDYVDVAERIREFRDKHPEGSLQQHSLQFITFAGKDWCVFTAAAYRMPDDPRPGMGTAWEPVPGRTPFTRDSELQNAETAAWGRAIVAALAADTKRIASANEVANRRADQQAEAAGPTREEVAQRYVPGLIACTDPVVLENVRTQAEAEGLLDVAVDTPGGRMILAQAFGVRQQQLAQPQDGAA